MTFDVNLQEIEEARKELDLKEGSRICREVIQTDEVAVYTGYTQPNKFDIGVVTGTVTLGISDLTPEQFHEIILQLMTTYLMFK